MPGPDFEAVVAGYYEPLYRFAISLARSEADACDLTQQTFYMWASKGHQLSDPSKVKSWLHTSFSTISWNISPPRSSYSRLLFQLGLNQLYANRAKMPRLLC
jgi:hypothetical protein